MNIEPLDIEQKEDSPEKIVAIQGMQTKYVLFGLDINKIRDKINELVAFTGMRKTSLNNTDNEFPTSAAVLNETTKKITKAERSEKVIASAVNVNNVDPEGKGLLTFSNPIDVTGIIATGLYEGQEIFILNNSTGILNIEHLSNDSAPGNRIFLQSGQNLPLRPNSFIRLRYSIARGRFELVNVVGTDVLASLAYAGNEQRVVTVTPDGVAYAEPIMEFCTYDETTSGFGSLSAVAAAYPTSGGYKKGFRVVCGFVTGGGKIYEKVGDSDAHWIVYNCTKMT